jgi:uncharacterized protein YjiS (DUF1127 family)
MAFANVTRSGEFGFFHGLGAFVEKVRDQRRRNRVYRQTLNELKSLSNRDLADLGIARSMIGAVAMEAAYGK